MGRRVPPRTITVRLCASRRMPRIYTISISTAAPTAAKILLVRSVPIRMSGVHQPTTRALLPYRKNDCLPRLYWNTRELGWSLGTLGYNKPVLLALSVFGVKVHDPKRNKTGSVIGLAEAQRALNQRSMSLR